MSFKLGLAQCGFPESGDVLAMAARLVEEAARESCALVCFPEDLMSPRPLSAEGLRELAEPLDGPFARAIAAMARERGIWIAFTMYERVDASQAPYNTAVMVSDAGEVAGVYRKCHLYDAHGIRESDRTASGSELTPAIEAPFATVGLGICYDLRFPELARAAALGGCDLLLFPSAWYAGPQKAEHWETLIRARAIENEVFVAGVCKAGSRYVGKSLVADPLGRAIVCGPEGAAANAETLVVCEIDMSEVAAARNAMPVFEHRRANLY